MKQETLIEATTKQVYKLKRKFEKIAGEVSKNNSLHSKQIAGFEQHILPFLNSNLDLLETLIRVLELFGKKSSLYNTTKLAGIDRGWKQIRKIAEKMRRRVILLKPPNQDKLGNSIRWLATNGEQEDLMLIKQVRHNPQNSSEDIQKLFYLAEKEIKKRLPLFQLLGHDTPFCQYPAPVVPIGYHKGELVAAYLDQENKEQELYSSFLPLEEDTTYVKYDTNNEQFSQLINDFDYLEDKLFAFSENDVRRYSVKDEKDFFSNLLKDESFSQDNPFLRRSLAKLTEDVHIIEPELIRCIQYLNEHAKKMIPDWYQNEKEKLSPIWEQQNLAFPVLPNLEC